MHVITADGAVLRAGRATLYVLEHLGFRRLARFFTYPPMIWFVELGYWIVARNRKLFAKFLFTSRDLRE